MGKLANSRAVDKTEPELTYPGSEEPGEVKVGMMGDSEFERWGWLQMGSINEASRYVS